MAQVSYRANLSSATFPMVISKAGRTSIIPGPDQNFDRRIDPSGDTVVSKLSVGIPQALFMQDVFPTIEGFQSIVYQPNAPNDPALGGSSINAIIRMSVTTSAGVKQLVRFVFFANASVKSSVGPPTSWAAVTVPGSWTAPTDENSMHWGMVQGVAYILRPDIGKLFTVSGLAPIVFTDVTAGVTGLGGVSALSMCSSYNYMIIASFDSIYWSSLTSPVDFVASLISGAGFTAIAGNETTIRFVLPHPSGFFIYTRHNVISARYTGNRANPWRFIPIGDSAEVTQKSAVAWNSESATHIAVISSGALHEINPNSANILLPEVTEYIEKEPYYDSFNAGTNIFTRVAKSGAAFISTQCRLILDKYLFISHIQPGGLSTPFKHVLIYDLGTRRMGKLVIDHNYIDDEGTQAVIASIGTSGVPDNKFFYVNYNIHTQTVGTFVATGVLLLGRFCFVRDQLLSIEQFDIQSVQSTEFIAAIDRQFTVILLLSIDGVNFDTIYVPTLVSISTILAKYAAHHPYTLEVCILLKGAFNIQSISFKASGGGKV